MEGPGSRFYRRCTELEIDLTLYRINCLRHGSAPAVYDSNINAYDCRQCVYLAIMYKSGKYYRPPVPRAATGSVSPKKEKNHES